MHGASTLLIGVMHKPASATDLTPASVFGFAARHSNDFPGEVVLAGPVGIAMRDIMTDEESRRRISSNGCCEHAVQC